MAKDPKAKDDAAEDAPPKSKKMMIIIIAVVVLLAGAGGAWFFLMNGDDKKDGEHGDEHHAEEEHEDPHAAPVFIPFETFTVNLQPDPEEHFLQLDLSLQVNSPEEQAKVEAMKPALRSRVLLLLGSKEANEISNTEGKELLIEEIVETVNEPLTEHGKPGKVAGGFFTSFVIQ